MYRQARTASGMNHARPSALAIHFDLTELSPTLTPISVNACAALVREDAAIASTATKLTRLLQSSETRIGSMSNRWVLVLLHEIICLNRGTSAAETHLRGGLAAWQERMVRSYVEETLRSRSLATLAALVRLAVLFLSCISRSRSESRLIATIHSGASTGEDHARRAAAALNHRNRRDPGFSDDHSFTTAFRKVVGQTPSRYQRSLG